MEWTFIQALIGVLRAYDKTDGYLSAKKYSKIRDENAASLCWVNRYLGYWSHIIDLLEGEEGIAVFLCSFCPTNLSEGCDYENCLELAFKADYFIVKKEDAELAKLSCGKCEHELNTENPMELITKINTECPKKGCKGILLIKAKKEGE